MQLTAYTTETTDGLEVCVGEPRRSSSGNGPAMIPVLISSGKNGKYDVHSWLPLTATEAEQIAAIDEAAKNS